VTSSSAGAAPVMIAVSQFACKLHFFDVDTLERLATIEDLVAQPHEVAWDPVRRLAYLSHTYRAGAYGEGKPKAHELSVIDPDRREVVDVIDISPYMGPHDVEFDPAADLIYTGVELVDGRNGIVIINPKTRTVEGAIALDAPNAHWLCITPDGARAYVTHKDEPQISVVDLRERRQIGAIPSAGGAEEIDVSPDGRYVFAAAPMMSLVVNVSRGQLNKRTPPPGTPTPRVLKIDTVTDTVVDEITFHEYVSAIRVAPDGRVIVSEMRFPDPGAPAAPPIAGNIYVIDPGSMTLLATVRGEELPFTIRCTPDSASAFVANLKTGSVTVIDLSTYGVRDVLDVNVGPAFGGSHGLCYVPAAA
jgi:DNA-binding beta-propeller fold protein YncE